MADADNGDYGGPGVGDGGLPAGSVALLSDPVDVIIDKLLRYVRLVFPLLNERHGQTTIRAGNARC
jgi:hypothetical protein